MVIAIISVVVAVVMVIISNLSNAAFVVIIGILFIITIHCTFKRLGLRSIVSTKETRLSNRGSRFRALG